MVRKFVPVVVLVCIVFALWWWLGRAEHRPGGSDDTEPTGGRIDDGSRSNQRDQHAETATGSRSPVAVRRMKSADERERLLTQIRAAQASRAEDGGTGSSEADDERLAAGPRRMGGGAYKDYIQDATREIVPLIAECYEMGLERVPELAGRITVEFTIEGEPDIGGLISASAVDPEQSTIVDAQVLECVQETMFAIEIDPPEGGGVVTVRYPFVFERGSPDGGAAR